MLRNYFKIALRNLFKNKVYLLVNLAGLAFAMSCCILSYTNYDYRNRFDETHRNTENIYRVNTMRLVDGNQQPWGITPATVGKFLQNDIKPVGEVTRLANKRVVLKSGDHVFYENIQFADQAFLDWFTLPLKAGAKSALANRSHVIINEKTAIKYFGKESAVGKELTLIGENGEEKNYVVGGVLDKIPTNSSFQIDIITNFENLYGAGAAPGNSWKSADELTIFIKVPAARDIRSVEARLAQYVTPFNRSQEEKKIAKFYLQPFRNIASTSDRDMAGFIDGRALNRNLRAVVMVMPSVLSVLILLITCFNFTNTAIAFAGNRLKEIGIRKVLGGKRIQLVVQFLIENLLISFSALLLAILVTDTLLPYFNQFLQIELKLNYLQNPELLGFLVLLAITTAFVSGFYPAFYISSFRPVQILKGKTKFSTGILNRILLTFQFSICALALVIGIVLTQNAAFQQQADMGYDAAMLDVVPVANEKEFALLQNAISRNPKILSTAGTQQQLGAGEASGVKVSYLQNEQEAQLLHIGDHYLATVGVKLLEGRLFKVRQESDYTKAVIVNQTFARQYSLERPIGAQLLLDSQYVNIVGVVQDYKEYGNHGRIPPMIFRVVKPAAYRYLNIKARPEDLKEVRAYVQAEWQKVIPTVPFQGFFQQELREKETLMNNGLQSICLVLAGLIMLLSAVGLYGLVSLNMLKRLKEIGIRKVLGASVIQIIGLVNREFIKIMLLAFGIGSAIGYVFVSKVVFTVMYTYHTEMSIWPFVITLLTLAGGAALTIGHKVYRAASLNPSVILQNE